MNVLALDLTSECGSLAIRSYGQTVTEQTLESRTGFAHLVFGAIERILADTGLTLHAIDCFAVSTGPGAFTALRVALAAAKGLAEVTGKPVIGVSKLRAMAYFGTATLRAVVIDARRGDVFAAVYSDKLEVIAEETVTRLEPWLSAALPKGDYELITLDNAYRLEALPVIEVPKSLASAVAKCAEDDLRQGAMGDPATLDANYVRRADAELYWTDS